MSASAKKSITRKTTLCLITCWTLAGMLAIADIVVCRKCGHEILDGGAVCTHCGTEAPKTEPVKEEPKEPEEFDRGRPIRKPGEYLDPKAVVTEVNDGRARMAKGDYDTARLFFKNAAALEFLTDPEQKSTRPKKILEYMKRCDTGGGVSKADCPTCGGSGKRTLRTETLTGTTEQTVPGGTCSTCSGTGYVLKSGRVKERIFKIGRAVSRYADLQRSKKYVPMGNAWIPREMDGKLTVREKVLLKRATASPCSDCMGIGRLECRNCKGSGRVKCTNSKCEQGMVVVETGGQLTKHKLRRTQKCKTCKGRGWEYCEDCRGKGSVLCEDCRGTGDRVSCTRCSGQGLSDCRKCRGTGLYKGLTCTTCQGAGVQQCTTCSGDGRKR